MLVNILGLAAMLALSSGYISGLPCRCPIEPESVERDFKSSAAVFLGEVVSVRGARGRLEARLRVSRSWKGIDTEEVSVFEPANSAESPNYRTGVSYLVYAGMHDGELFTGMCSRTKPEALAQRDLQQLGEGQKPKRVRG